MNILGWIAILFFVAVIYGLFLVVEHAVNSIFEEEWFYDDNDGRDWGEDED